MNEAIAETNEPRAVPLSDVMLAMDVVDTLRHRQSLVERVLDADNREQALLEKVKALYASQGIEVTDEIVAEGVRALKEQRFAYSPAPPGLKTRLFHVYVNRGRWARRLLVVVFLGVAVWGLHYGFVRAPQQKALAELQAIPTELGVLRGEALQIGEVDEARSLAERLYQDGVLAVNRGEREAADQSLQQLQALLRQLRQEYQVEVIYRPGESSGIWRIPPNNDEVRNYYLIVEAVDSGGRRLRVPIRSEEDQQTRMVEKWGIRVSEDLFNAMRDDKQDDGIIQNSRVGAKRRGFLAPEYSVDTAGGAITQW